MTSLAVLRLITREHCSLCHDAEERLVAAASRRGVAVEVIDVDRDPDLVARYGSDVPVVLSSSGEVRSSGPLSRREAGSLVREAKRAAGG